MGAAEEAYAAAERRIEECKREGASKLDFDRDSTSALTTLPPEISSLSHLELLDLGSTQVSDLTPIAGLTGLTALNLNYTQVANLSPIAGLTGLTALNLNSTQVADLSPIAGLTDLNSLHLDSTQVTDFSPIAGLMGLTDLRLNNTQVADLSPIAGLTALTTLTLMNTQIADLSPIAELMSLTFLDLDNTQVADLRPLRRHDKLIEQLHGFGLHFRGSTATKIDPRIKKISEIGDATERATTLFEYLEDWEPPAIWIDEELKSDPLTDVTLENSRLEIAATLPTEADRDERLKQVLHERLKPKAADLARLAGNQYIRLAARARALVEQVDRDFDQLDMLLLHLEVEDLTDRSEAGHEDDLPFTDEIKSALNDVLRLGPGLTLDHPAVELLMERTARMRADPPTSETSAAHDALSEVIAKDEAAIGDNLREREATSLALDAKPAKDAIQDSTHRSLLVRIGRLALQGTAATSGAVAVGLWAPTITTLLHGNMPTFLQVAATYGASFQTWLIAALGEVAELTGSLAAFDLKPLKSKHEPKENNKP